MTNSVLEILWEAPFVYLWYSSSFIAFLKRENDIVRQDGFKIIQVHKKIIFQMMAVLVLSLGFATTVYAWDLSTASYDSVSFYVGSQAFGPQELFFKPDGTELYVLHSGSGSSNYVYQYTLSTPWDVTTATYNGLNIYVGSETSSNTTAFAFKGDGTKMYVGSLTNDFIYQYTLATPWDISTASYDSVSFYIGAQLGSIQGVAFKGDGSKMYTMGYSSDRVFQYTLSTPWDLSTASYDSVNFYLWGGNLSGFTFKPDGSKMYVIDYYGADEVRQFTLSTPWDVSTASYDSISFSGVQDGNSSGVAFKQDDGSKMYTIGSTGDRVYVYSVTPPDSEAPTTSITAPTSGTTVSGTSVTLSATATDNVGVAGVKFYIEDALVGSEATTSPYSVIWDSTATVSENKTLYAVARDAAGNAATSTSIIFTVDNTSAPTSVDASTSEDSATITWTTVHPGSSQVFFGIVSSIASSTLERDTSGGEVTSHSVTISELLSCTTYRYKAVSKSVGGLDTATSSESTFTTTGCSGGTTVTDTEENTIATSTGGTVLLDTLDLSIPANFSSVAGSLIFQVSTLEPEAFISSVGTPVGTNRVGKIYRLAAFTDEATPVTSFDQPITITIAYMESDISGLDAGTLTIYRYDGSSWSALSDCSVDTAAQTVSCTTTSFSDFGIFGEEIEEISSGSSSSSRTSASVRQQLAYYLDQGDIADAARYFYTWKYLLSNAEQESFKQQLIAKLSILLRSSDGTSSSGSLWMFTRDLEFGSIGEDVLRLQRFLNTDPDTHVAEAGVGSTGNETEYFGPLTEKAVQRLQTKYGIVSSGTPSSTGYGRVGPLTRVKLNEILQ